ncbi:MAG: hypothetical protein IPH12_01790 [Saprospirales bacterium]|nr:hypothetical protein [Saprospirales bacterium]MBK8921615.1 hypothetical protein [Saprospirales bacterium]
MKRYFFYFMGSVLLAGLASVNACKKDGSINSATIEILSPTAGQMFNAGEEAPIKATLTGKEQLHGWKVELRKKTDGTLLFTKEMHTHDLILVIDETWTNTLTEHTDLVLEVFAQIDHDGTLTSKTVEFHAHPG